MVDVVLNHAGYGLKMTDKICRMIQFHIFQQMKIGHVLRNVSRWSTDTVKGELSGLPDFITEDPEVRRQIIQWQTQWIDSQEQKRGIL